MSPVPTRIALVAARWHADIVDRAVTACRSGLAERQRQDMKAISKTVAGTLVIASLIGGSAAAAVASAATPATTIHPAPQAATAIEYALIAS